MSQKSCRLCVSTRLFSAALLRAYRAWFVMLLSAFASVHGAAQLPTTLSTPSPLSGLVRASDGNYYAATYVPDVQSYAYNCMSGIDPCGAIYRITPAGVVTKLFDFSAIAGHADGTTPNPLVLGPDGALYGTTLNSGTFNGSPCPLTAGCGGIFYRLGLDGTFTVLQALTGGDLGNGSYQGGGGLFGRLVLGSDGNFYSVVRDEYDSGAIFRLSMTGQATKLYSFDNANTGYEPTGLVEGDDGNFYGTVESGSTSASSTASGGIFRMTTGGTVSLVANFSGSVGYEPFGPLVEGANGVFYGSTQGSVSAGSVTVAPTVFSYSNAAGLQLLHGFAQSGLEGLQGDESIGGLLLGSDGNLYGTAENGGYATKTTGVLNSGYGAFFSVTPSGAFTLLRQFTNGATDAAYPVSPLLQDSDGTILGAASTTTLMNPSSGVYYPANGTLFDYNAGAAAPVQLSFTDPTSGTAVGTVGVNGTVTLNWQVLEAFSNTARVCYAAVQGSPAGAGVWTGKQTGSATATGYAGSTAITPTVAGTYVYALTCGGVETGFATLVVSGTDQITTTSLPGGAVSQAYTTQLTATGGKAPYTWSAAGSTYSNIVRAGSDHITPHPLGGPIAGLPEGLTLNAGTGVISGTPTQFGTGTVQLVVLDSSVPANKATASLPIAVVANLRITTPSLKKATVGGNYKQQLTAAGGLPPYTWSVSAGTLPAGLMLNATTGLITGAPTVAGDTMLTFQVADSEKVPATLTASFTLKVMPKIAVAALEITQAIQQYQLIDDFDSLVTANGGEPLVPLVVGKPAVARFYLTAVKDATTVTLKVDGVVTETKTLKATPNCQPEDARAHTNNCPSLDFYFTPSAT